jgi:hypothetical protein
MRNQPSKVEEDAGGRPEWITNDLIDQMIQAFDPPSGGTLTEADAVGMILSLNQLLEAVGLLKLGRDHEEVHGVGTSQQPGAGT